MRSGESREERMERKREKGKVGIWKEEMVGRKVSFKKVRGELWTSKLTQTRRGLTSSRHSPFSDRSQVMQQ